MRTTYFKKIQELLTIEENEDRQQFELLSENAGLNEKRLNGILWHPLAIRATEPGKADSVTVTFERTSFKDLFHQFRTGVRVRLYSNSQYVNEHIEGMVTWQNGDQIKVNFPDDELPDWVSMGKLCLQMMFDENSYAEMKQAVKTADALAEDEKSGHLIRVLTGRTQPNTETTQLPEDHFGSLNENQQAAVRHIISGNDLSVLHGPPGTGKTTTLVEAIYQVWKKEEKKILVTAPSNTAVDLLCERLHARGLKVVRVGNPAKVNPELMSLTLDQQVAAHPQSKLIRQLKKRASEFRDMAHKYKRQFGRAEREQRKALFDEAGKLMKEVISTEKYIVDNLISEAQVIAATLVGSNHHTVRDLRYNHVFIDEAGQALEPAMWIPILKGEKIVMAGDPLQLPPTIKSKQAEQGGLGETLMEKCMSLYPQAVNMLRTQYRMHHQIMEFPSIQFYGKQLIAASENAHRSLKPDDKPFVFIDTAGCGFEEQQAGSSISNPEEAGLLFRHLDQFIQEFDKEKREIPTIGVIAPYRQQVLLLKEMAEEHPELQKYGKSISINTIDSFQGQERDVIYISLTRSNTAERIGFLSELRRMNVAMTRAKSKLVIIGDSSTISATPFYDAVVGYATEKDGWISAWELMSL